MRDITISEQLMLDVARDGGFTFHPSKSVPEEGYVVGKHNVMTCNGIKPIPSDLLRLAIEEIHSDLSGCTYLGGWYNKEEDKTYYDVVEIYPSKEEYRTKEIAKKRGELAIFSLHENKEIFV